MNYTQVKLKMDHTVVWEDVNWEEFKKYWPVAAEEKPAHKWEFDNQIARLSDAEVVGITLLGIKMEVVPYPGAMLTKMQDRHAWERGLGVSPEDFRSGNAIQITIPDMALMFIDEVEIMEDCCTHELQRMLDDGWRLLAVCPPNSQRRPDYVMGRVKTKEKR